MSTNHCPACASASAHLLEWEFSGLGDSCELEMTGLSGVERLGHGERLVPEGGFGREQFDVDQVAGQFAQCEERLETGHAAAGDQNTETAVAPG